VQGSFVLDEPVEPGEYYLALAILDPAGEMPSLRLAIQNYLNGGRHPIGWMGVGRDLHQETLDPATFDDPYEDRSLRYYP
jgi:hypothetical protein